MSSPKKGKKKSRSNVWYFYDKEKSDDGHTPIVKCRLCKKIIKTSGNTTNLQNHVMKKHPQDWKQCLEVIKYAGNNVCYVVEAAVDGSGREVQTEGQERTVIIHENGVETSSTVPQIVYVASANYQSQETPSQNDTCAGEENSPSQNSENVSQSDSLCVVSKPAYPKMTPAKRGRPRKHPRPVDEDYVAPETPKPVVVKTEISPEDQLYDNFGAYVASILKNMKKQRACDMQNKIIGMLFEDPWAGRDSD